MVMMQCVHTHTQVTAITKIGYSYMQGFTNLVSILQIMDDLSWADNIVQDILVSCRLEITINVELWIIINGLPSLPTDVINLLCPEECSGHGTCNNGMLWFNCSPVSLLGLRVLLFFPCTHHPAPLPWHSPPVA